MAWFTRIDRFGDSHLCYSQEAQQSCGLACVKMILFKINKFRPGHDAITTETWVEQIYKKHDATAVNVGDEGIDLNCMVGALNEMKIGTWEYASPPNQDIPGLLIDKMNATGYPIILGVHWGGGGGHAVLLDTMTKIPLVDVPWGAVCDPGDGDVHVIRLERGKQLSYNGRRVKWSFNAWGSPEFNYPKMKTIQGVVTEIAYCKTKPKFFD
jgi:hypothetical protein